MNLLNKENILNALRAVRDPDLGKDIVTLNFVQDIVIQGNDLSFSLVLTTPACPVRDQFKTEAERAIRNSIEDVGTVTITLSSSVTSRPSEPSQALLPGVKNTIAVASGKGGVGKSTIAVNLAVALALDGARVGLIDCDVYGPSIPLMMNIHERPKMHNQKLLPLESYGVKVMSIGFLVDPMQAVIWRGPMASSAIRQFLTDVEWGDLDYLIFDLPPGTGDIQLTIVQQLPLTGAVIVTTPQEISLADARKSLAMFSKVHVPILGLIENMSFFLCSHCGSRENIFDAGGGETAAKACGVPFLGEIPIDTNIRIGGDSGKPIIVSDPKNPRAEQIVSIARKLAAQISIVNLKTVSPVIDITLNT